MSSTIVWSDDKPSFDIQTIYPILDDFGVEEWTEWDDEMRSAVILGYFIATYNWMELFPITSIDLLVSIMDETKAHSTWSLMRVVTDYLQDNPQVALRAAFILPFSDTIRWSEKEDTK